MKNILFLFLLIPSIVLSQGWEKQFNTGKGYSGQQTSDGGYIVAGFTLKSDTSSFIDAILVKTNSLGDTLWTKTYGGVYNEVCNSVKQTSDGGYILTGYTETNDTLYFYDVFLIKTDMNGDTLWTKTYGKSDNNNARSVEQTIDGGYIISGSTRSNSRGFDDLFLIKTDMNGDTLWTQIYDWAYKSYGRSIQQTSDGGYIISGSFEANSTLSDAYLVKTDVYGDTIWTKTYGGDFHDRAYSVDQTSDGGFVLVCKTSYSQWGPNDIFLIKTDDNGNVLWDKTFGGTESDIGYSVQQTLDGGYIVTGTTNLSTSSYTDIYLIKTDNFGDTLWTRTIGGSFSDESYSVQQTLDEGYIVFGYQNDGVKDKIYLVKTDSFGNITYTNTIDMPVLNTSRTLLRNIDFLGREIINPIKNKPYIEIYDDGTSQKKMLID